MSAAPHPDPEPREARLAHNEVVFRSVNESIEQQAIAFGGPDAYEFICECAQSTCFDRIELTLSEYERVRAEGTRFVVVPGHENALVEQVVATYPTFSLVEKDGTAGIVAADEDPRGDQPEPA